MACDTAFRVIARHYLHAVAAEQEGSLRGDAPSIHRMRIALTHLRTSIRFFSPMLRDAEKRRISRELKWLHRTLGEVRDLDVAIRRLKQAGAGKDRDRALRRWTKKREHYHRRVARKLRSARYRHLLHRTCGWIEAGPWSATRKKARAEARGAKMTAFVPARLENWQRKLLKMTSRLERMDPEERHRLRLWTKRLTCAIESLHDAFPQEQLCRHEAALELLRRAQKCLGQLNDHARGQELAAIIEGPASGMRVHFMGRKQERGLLQKAARSYKELRASSTLVPAPGPGNEAAP